MKNLYTTILMSVAFLAVSSTAYGDDDDELEFEAKLSGAQEVVIEGGVFVPGGVDTDARGKIEAEFEEDLSEVEVKLRVRNVPAGVVLTRAHFHCGRPGQNGPIIFGLVDPGPLSFDGNRIRGTLINDDVNAPAIPGCESLLDRPVNNIASLAFAMRDGLIYFNVHTNANPGGEIRGQMLPDD